MITGSRLTTDPVGQRNTVELIKCVSPEIVVSNYPTGSVLRAIETDFNTMNKHRHPELTYSQFVRTITICIPNDVFNQLVVCLGAADLINSFGICTIECLGNVPR